MATDDTAEPASHPNADPLAQPLSLPCGAGLDNRLAKAAMTEGLADPSDNPDDRLCTLYRRWSKGGAGLHITGNVMVDRRYLERPGNVVIDEHSDRDALTRWAEAGTVAGNHLWMQISHPGRQCNRASGHQPVAPSAVPLGIGPMFRKPRALEEDEIRDIIRRYAYVARVARESGFTGVQVHGAHGYLISQFLSPRSNRREDRWGGELASRARLLLEIVQAVRETVGSDYPVAVKLNSADFQHGGFTDEECVQVARWLDQAGVDLLELSGGSYEQPQFTGHAGLQDSAAPPKRQSTLAREAYFLRYAARVKAAVELPVMVTGGFRSREAMTHALAQGDADVIGVARPLAVDPAAPSELLQHDIDALSAYENRLHLGHGRFGPTSPWLLFRVINVQGEVAWFYRQMVRLADGQEPDRRLGLVPGLWQHLLSEWRLGRRRSPPEKVMVKGTHVESR